VISAFMDGVIFPVHVSSGTAGGPDWPADIVTLSSGREERNTAWSAPLRSYDAKYGVRKPQELYEILSLYHVARGRLRGFRLLDWTDYRSGAPNAAPTATDQPIGTGDGQTAEFQLVKRYFASDEDETFDRTITRPYGMLLIATDGEAVTEGWSVDKTTGKVTFDVAPVDGAVLTWGGQFHVPARFDCKLDQISVRTAAIGDIPSILLKELRE
jgi:uncharacterized protein (TIGR02217 family)